MFREHWMGISRTAVAAAVAIIVAAPALAQNTTAGIAGRVTGADGKPLAGASVTIVHMESRSTNTVATDADGRYGARGLRAGGPIRRPRSAWTTSRPPSTTRPSTPGTPSSATSPSSRSGWARSGGVSISPSRNRATA